jgi:hypothetical protein
MTETDAIIGSNQLFDKYVQLVRDDQWDLPTANADWNVRQLVNHLVNEGLVQTAYDWFMPQAEGWRGAGILGPAVPVHEDADLQTKLLAISGRRSVPTK